MTSAPPLTPPAPAPAPAGVRSARLSLKPATGPTGYVDGGWWPRSRELAQELPGLLAGLRGRLGPVESVSYHLGDWTPPPHRMSVDGVSFRTAGYHFQRPSTVDVIARTERITLLVIAPEESEQTANRALEAAASPGGTDDIATLLTALHPAQLDEPRKS
ncbi:MAG TPA: DUF5994 family protein [Pseudonocardia sp.]|jgi:hypothetical protein